MRRKDEEHTSETFMMMFIASLLTTAVLYSKFNLDSWGLFVLVEIMVMFIFIIVWMMFIEYAATIPANSRTPPMTTSKYTPPAPKKPVEGTGYSKFRKDFMKGGE